jgi:hypothetical protein
MQLSTQVLYRLDDTRLPPLMSINRASFGMGPALDESIAPSGTALCLRAGSEQCNLQLQRWRAGVELAQGRPQVEDPQYRQICS